MQSVITLYVTNYDSLKSCVAYNKIIYECVGVGAASRRARATPHRGGEGLILFPGIDDGCTSIQRQECEVVFMMWEPINLSVRMFFLDLTCEFEWDSCNGSALLSFFSFFLFFLFTCLVFPLILDLSRDMSLEVGELYICIKRQDRVSWFMILFLQGKLQSRNASSFRLFHGHLEFHRV